MERAYNIATLIRRYISAEASAAERQEVEEWLNESPRHRLLMEKFRSADYPSGQMREYEIFDIDRAFKRFRQRKQRRERRRTITRVTATAAAMILLAVGLWIGREQGPRPQPPVAAVLSPGSSKALLILDDGRKVFLTDSVRMEFTQPAAKVQVLGDRLCYLGDSLPVGQQTKPVAPAINKVVTSRGGEYKLMLSDGTQVWVNADSRLEFPAVFTGERREVYVQGEVYFEVAKDSLHPFIVTTDKARLRVLGTSFNVRAYPRETYRTTLIEGCVEILHQQERVRLQPRQQWLLDDAGAQVISVNPRVAAGWRNGCFAFDDEPLANVFQELERWYDVQVFVSGEGAKAMKFTGIFPRYGNMDKVLEIIKLATGLRYAVNGRTVVVSRE